MCSSSSDVSYTSVVPHSSLFLFTFLMMHALLHIYLSIFTFLLPYFTIYSFPCSNIFLNSLLVFHLYSLFFLFTNLHPYLAIFLCKSCFLNFHVSGISFYTLTWSYLQLDHVIQVDWSLWHCCGIAGWSLILQLAQCFLYWGQWIHHKTAWEVENIKV
jgi:hypothetical protein